MFFEMTPSRKAAFLEFVRDPDNRKYVGNPEDYDELFYELVWASSGFDLSLLSPRFLGLMERFLVD